MKKKLLKLFKKNIYLFALFIILSLFTDFFFNIYAIQKRDIDERLMRSYGFNCEKNSYGFISLNKKKYFNEEKGFKVINNHAIPTVQYLFKDFKYEKKKSLKNLILLNFENLDKSNINITKYNINLDNYDLINKSGNCYYYKKND